MPGIGAGHRVPAGDVCELLKANHRALINGLPVYDSDHIERAVQKHRVKRLLLALDADSGVDRKALLRQLEPLAIPADGAQYV